MTSPQPMRKEAHETKRAEPIMDNAYVKELLSVMRDNAATTKDFVAMLSQVTAMEKQLNAAVVELNAMRKQLDEAKAMNHPAQSIMERAVVSAQNTVNDLRTKLAEIKDNIINGCKNALDAVKEKGIAALGNIMDFFKIKPGLESVRNEMDKTIAFDNKAINKIQTISKNYHEAGKHLKNVGRALLGKEPIKDAKPVGKIADAFCVTLKADRAISEGIKKRVESALGCISRIEQRAAEKKPSLMDTLNALDKKVAQDKKDAPATEKPSPSKGER